MTTSESHVGPGFVATFGEALSMLRKLFQTTSPSSQPFVISGSGTLGWDLVAANLVEPGEDVLVLSTGYFSDGFADCLKVYGAHVDLIKAPVGSRPQLPEIEQALKSKKYKMITVTHVDTSTGVLSELQKLSETVQRVSPDTLLIVDGVCSVASEEIDFDAWKLDGVITASQKAIGCPAGLSISMFSGKAMDAFKARKSPPSSYFASMKNWTPSMLQMLTLCIARVIDANPLNSHAKLRSKEAIVLCDAITTAHPCPAYSVKPDPHQTPLRKICETPRSIG